MAAIDLSLGCIFIGVILNVWLYGFSCVQAYIYYSRFKDDKKSMRFFVASLFTADTLNTVLDITFLYKYTVSNFGDGVYGARANNEFATDPILVSLIGFMTQLFFAWRVWKLSNSRFAAIVPIAIAGVGFISFLAAIGTTAGVVIVRQFAEFQKFQVAVIVWLAGAALADAIITVSLIITLHKARTGFSHTDDIITKLIRATLQTGLITASFAVIDLILFLSSSTTLHLVFNLPLSKLYINSLLSTLNARAFTSNARYTMHSSVLRNGQVNQLNQAESGAVRSETSNKNFKSVGSNSEVTAVAAAGQKKGFLKALGGKTTQREQQQQRKEEGIQIVTIEERFESDHPNGPQALAYSTPRGPRTPGESRKSSNESLDGNDDGNNFGLTQESLAMDALTVKGDNEPQSPAQDNHPYKRY